MSVTVSRIVGGMQLPSSIAAQYTCPRGQAVAILDAVLTNSTDSSATVTFHMVPSGKTASNATKILDAYPVNAHTAHSSPEIAGIALSSGDSIQAFASAASAISMRLSGIVQS